MMPMDPFFTSAVTKDDFHERQQARKAFAKAAQFRRFAANVSVRHAHNAFEKHLKGVNDAQNCAKVYVHNKVQVAGRRALTGFKPPQKKWQHRNSQHPTA